MAQAVSQKLCISIASIRPIGDVSLLEVTEDILVTHVDQGADDVSVLRAHGGEAGHTGAAKQSQEKSFGLIIFVMSDGNAGSPVLFSEIF